MANIICPKCSASNAEGTAYCGKCGERLLGTGAFPGQEQGDPLIGTLVGDRFLIHEKLGEGGMGVVYRAEQTAIKRQVALKVLHQALTKEESLHARFHNEAEASSRLTHPNTVTIFDFGQTNEGSLYIAMEFIKGKNLDDELQENGPMDVGRVCHIMGQACGSLADAHANKIVHRDLKPENIMLCDRAGQTDVVKVLDFGIAKVLEDDGQDQRKALTKTGMVFGTPQYMSPEQIRGEKVDNRTDVYSMGVIMYQMLTGELPFTAETPMGALSKHLVDDPPTFTEINRESSIPDRVEAVVMAALEKKADDRPQSMNELYERLQEAVGDAAPAAAAPIAKTQVSPAETPAPAAATSPDKTAAMPGPGAKPLKGSPETLAKTQVSPVAAPMPGVDPPPPKAKSKKPMLIVATVVIVLAVVSTIVALYVMNKKDDPETPPVVVAPPVNVQPPVTQPVTPPPPTTPPTNALPTIPENPDATTDTTPAPSDVRCKFVPPPNGDQIGVAITAKLRRNQKNVKKCARKGADGQTRFTWVVSKNSSSLRPRKQFSGNPAVVDSCLSQVLAGDVGTRDPRAAHKGTVAFDLKYKNKTIRKCQVVVTAQTITPVKPPTPGKIKKRGG